MKLYFDYPGFQHLKQIVNTNEFPDRLINRMKRKPSGILKELRDLEKEVIVLEDIKNYITRLVVSTHPRQTDLPAVKQYVLYGASPRAGIYLLRAAKWKALLEHRVNVAYEDVEELAFDILNHRIILNFDAEAESVEVRSLLNAILHELAKTHRVRT
jgi:MoxR-like ATPase